MTSNPYEPVDASASHINAIAPSRCRWTVVGFILASTPFVMLGVYGLYFDAQYAATLPPGTPRCGNSAIAAMLLIFPVSPFFGSIGAVVGFISAVVYQRATSIPGLGLTADACEGEADKRYPAASAHHPPVILCISACYTSLSVPDAGTKSTAPLAWRLNSPSAQQKILRLSTPYGLTVVRHAA